MKTITLNKMDFPLAPYPNAATRRDILHRIVDHLLIIASCAGIAMVFLFLAAMA